MPGLRAHTPRRGGPAHAAVEGPASARDRERGDQDLAQVLVEPARAEHRDDRLGRQPVEAGKPGAVDDPHARSRDLLFREHLVDDLGARGGRPLEPQPGAELLEDHLGREVVALVVHEAQDEVERHGLDRGQWNRVGLGHAGQRTARDRDPRPQERLSEGQSGRERGLAGQISLIAPAVDDERRQSRRLGEEEVRLPARPGPPRVEERLVADDVPAHAPDPLRAELRRQREQVERRQRRVAVALEDDVAAPERAVELPLAEDVRREAIARPEGQERGVRDCELLVRSGDQRQAQVVRIELLATRQVDGERG